MGNFSRKCLVIFLAVTAVADCKQIIVHRVVLQSIGTQNVTVHGYQDGHSEILVDASGGRVAENGSSLNSSSCVPAKCDGEVFKNPTHEGRETLLIEKRENEIVKTKKNITQLIEKTIEIFNSTERSGKCIALLRKLKYHVIREHRIETFCCIPELMTLLWDIDDVPEVSELSIILLEKMIVKKQKDFDTMRRNIVTADQATVTRRPTELQGLHEIERTTTGPNMNMRIGRLNVTNLIREVTEIVNVEKEATEINPLLHQLVNHLKEHEIETFCSIFEIQKLLSPFKEIPKVRQLLIILEEIRAGEHRVVTSVRPDYKEVTMRPTGLQGLHEIERKTTEPNMNMRNGRSDVTTLIKEVTGMVNVEKEATEINPLLHQLVNHLKQHKIETFCCIFEIKKLLSPFKEIPKVRQLLIILEEIRAGEHRVVTSVRPDYKEVTMRPTGLQGLHEIERTTTGPNMNMRNGRSDVTTLIKEVTGIVNVEKEATEINPLLHQLVNHLKQHNIETFCCIFEIKKLLSPFKEIPKVRQLLIILEEIRAGEHRVVTSVRPDYKEVTMRPKRQHEPSGVTGEQTTMNITSVIEKIISTLNSTKGASEAIRVLLKFRSHLRGHHSVETFCCIPELRTLLGNFNGDPKVKLLISILEEIKVERKYQHNSFNYSVLLGSHGTVSDRPGTLQQQEKPDINRFIVTTTKEIVEIMRKKEHASRFIHLLIQLGKHIMRHHQVETFCCITELKTILLPLKEVPKFRELFVILDNIRTGDLVTIMPATENTTYKTLTLVREVISILNGREGTTEVIYMLRKLEINLKKHGIAKFCCISWLKKLLLPYKVFPQVRELSVILSRGQQQRGSG